MTSKSMSNRRPEGMFLEGVPAWRRKYQVLPKGVSRWVPLWHRIRTPLSSKLDDSYTFSLARTP